MVNEDEIKKRFYDLRKSISRACKKANRSDGDVHLLAVSKGHSAEAVKCLYDLGQRDFGENYIDEMLLKKKSLTLSCPDIKWHFIGKIQTNKIAKIALADVIQTVCSTRHATLLSKCRDYTDPLSIFIQIKLQPDKLRSGVDLADAERLFVAIKQSNFICIKGLMTILPLSEQNNPVDGFTEMKHLLDSLNKSSEVDLVDLSMGMSSDFSAAIAAGSTWIRIGTLLFGERKS